MPVEKTELAEFEIGHFHCPKTHAPVPLKASRPLAFLDWPFVVERCPECQEKHLLQAEDVHHRPIFGYE